MQDDDQKQFLETNEKVQNEYLNALGYKEYRKEVKKYLEFFDQIHFKRVNSKADGQSCY